MKPALARRLKRAVAAAGGPLFHLAQQARDAARCLAAGAPTVPYGTDGVGYETLIRFIERRDLLALPGDLLEIGARFGGGSLKLSLWLERKRSEKVLHVVELFGLDWERPEDAEDDLYLPELRRRYEGRSQREIFDSLCAGRPNLKLWAADSAKLDAPGLLCFGFVDGNHEPRYVENDFALAWDALAPGGAVALHDYRGKLPQVTKTIDRILKEREAQIESVELGPKTLVFVTKKPA